jgi:hypothetical protein
MLHTVTARRWSGPDGAGSVLTAAFSILAPLAGSLLTTLIPAS